LGARVGDIVDIHAHVVLEGTLGTAERYGPLLDDREPANFRAGGYSLSGVRYRGSAFMDVHTRLRAMDAAGIDRQVLSPNPLTFFHHIDPRLAVSFAKKHNDLLAELVSDHSRLDGLAQLPLQDPEAAVEELRRSVAELGLKGAYIGNRTTRELDDPAFDALWATSIELAVPVFLHPAPDAVDAPTRDPRLGRWDLDLLIGFAHEETLTVATLIYGGVLHRHPSLRLCISHGGGAAPFLLGRLRAAALRRPWTPDWLHEVGEFDRMLRRLWFDCHVHDRLALELLVQSVGVSRIVFGTNFAGWDQGTTQALGPHGPQVHRNTLRLLEPGLAR
jgi:aminocarboxymuconate-semialdehyde decarboxylase